MKRPYLDVERSEPLLSRVSGLSTRPTGRELVDL
jgi:hypothetical protein